jgi:hypothetical protein
MLLPVSLAVPAIAAVTTPGSPVSPVSVSLSFARLFSLRAVLVLLRDSLDGLLVPGLREWDWGVVGSWLRVPAADA